MPTTAEEPIVCKPTPWFILRAVVMVVMFGVFSVLFFIDGSTGYRKKNEAFYLHKAFQTANDEFSKQNAGGTLTPEAWRAYAGRQAVAFPADRAVLPEGLELPMAWPPVLHDYERMKPLQWNILWQEYSRERGMPVDPGEEPYDARKIHEQWVVFYVCAAATVVALFFLLRTLGRSIRGDAEAVTTQAGRRVPYEDMKTLDLRKWDTKGLAFIDYAGASGTGRIRLDGLTYGGFKKEAGEPAERLMRRIRARFSGEVIEYAPAAAVEPPAGPPAEP